MNIFIVDDSEVVRTRLRTILSKYPGFNIIGQDGKPLEAIKSIKNLQPDVVILDIRMPGMSGIDVIKFIKKDKPDIIVIMLTNYPYPQYRKESIQKGADFFFNKSTEFGKIPELLKQIENKTSIKESS